STSAIMRKCASRWRCCDSPSTTRRQQRPRSPPSSTAPPPWERRRCGRRFRLTCWRQLPATHSATQPPPGTPSNTPSTSPKPSAPLLPSPLPPAPALLGPHPRHHTAHAALITQILDLLTGTERPPPCPAHLREPLSDSETRILRYLPTNLTAPEIADQLYVSVHTVKTHIRHLYTKLGTHHRAETLEQARPHGLLAPSLRNP